MKKFFMIAVMAVAALSAKAQQEVGTFSIMPRFGAGMSILQDFNDDLSNNMCFAVGAEGQYQISENFAISAGLDYDYYMSSESKINGIDQTVKFGYLDIPVMAHLTFGNFAVGAGIQPGFKVYSKMGSYDLGDIKSTRFDIPLEATYTFGDDYVLGIRYNLPLTKVADYQTISPKVSGVMLSLGYRFDL